MQFSGAATTHLDLRAFDLLRFVQLSGSYPQVSGVKPVEPYYAPDSLQASPPQQGPCLRLGFLVGVAQVLGDFKP